MFSKPRNFHFHSISSDKPNLSYSWLQTQLASSKFEATISKTSLRTQKETHELEKAKMTITVNNAVKDAEQRSANEFDLERTTLKNELLEMKAENLALKNSINHPYGFCICCTEPLQKDGIISQTCGHTGLCTSCANMGENRGKCPVCRRQTRQMLLHWQEGGYLSLG